MNMVAPRISKRELSGTNIQKRGNIPTVPTMALVQALGLNRQGETVFA